jgi:glycosyltransferase involved in cell wall biosynthesis
MHHVLHAADISLFAKALDPDLPLPEDIAGIPSPRVGVVGVHDERLDVDALVTIAREEPSWHVILVGPVQPGDVDEAALRELPNVHLLGGKTLEELPAYLKALDVALIPYKVNELTRNIFPLKLYEYLAAGLPVVAGNLPELAPFSDRVALATSPREYVSLVRAALASDDAEARAARSACAAENSWDKRVEEISDLVEQMLVNKKTTMSLPNGESL